MSFNIKNIKPGTKFTLKWDCSIVTVEKFDRIENDFVYSKPIKLLKKNIRCFGDGLCDGCLYENFKNGKEASKTMSIKNVKTIGRNPNADLYGRQVLIEKMYK